MTTGARVDAWLARHGVWFLPAVLGAFVLATVAAIAWEHRRVDDAPAALLPHRGVEASPARRGTPVPPADTVRAELPALPSAMRSREGQVEVCGVGWVGVDAGGGADLDAVANAPAVARQRRELVRQLGASGDAFGRAAATVLAMNGAADGAGAGSTAGASTAVVQRLGEQATTTADPRVYALAWRLCHARGDDAAVCRSLSLGQWSRLDDGNALPWLHALDDAARRDDAAARDDALARIAAARRLDRRAYAMPAAIADLAGRDDTALLAAWTLGVDAIAVDGAGGTATANAAPPFGPLVDACRGATLANADRAGACNAAADLLLQRSDAFESWSAGAAIARALGRDTQLLDETARRTGDALAAARVNAYDCPRLRRDLARWQSGAAVGQMAALR